MTNNLVGVEDYFVNDVTDAVQHLWIDSFWEAITNRRSEISVVTTSCTYQFDFKMMAFFQVFFFPFDTVSLR